MVAPPEIALPLEQWHDFFILAGTAAATLMGLLFVSISLHLEVVVHDQGKHLNAMAWESFFGFMWVLVISLLFLVPGYPIRPMGAFLILMGAIRLVIMAANSKHLLGRGDAVVTRKVLIRRFVPHLLANLLLILVGRMMVTHTAGPEGLLLLFTVITLLLVTATGSAWDLLLRIGRLKALQASGRESGESA